MQKQNFSPVEILRIFLRKEQANPQYTGEIRTPGCTFRGTGATTLRPYCMNCSSCAVCMHSRIALSQVEFIVASSLVYMLQIICNIVACSNYDLSSLFLEKLLQYYGKRSSCVARVSGKTVVYAVRFPLHFNIVLCRP